MSELKPYPKYKDSGVEWIGEIPEGWDVVAFNRVVRKVNNGISLPQINEKTNYHVTRIETISGGEVDYNKIGYVNGSERLKNYKLNEGDILFSHINSLKIVGNTALYKGNRVLYHGVNLLRIQSLETIDYTWLHYMLRTHYFKSNLQSIAQHAINQVSVPISKSKQLKVLKPSYIEQGKVKRFLNDQTSEIDSLVSDKKKLIELLEEKRQAVITETVTKGLDPTVKMKDSGIEWIGDIPDHWGVSKVKYHTILNRETLSESTNPDKKIKYIDIGSVDSQGNIKNIETLNYRSSPSRARRVVENGDTIVSTVRTYLQAITMIDENTAGHIVSTGFAVLTPLKSVVNEYLGLYFRSRPVLDRIVSISKGISYPAVNSSDLIQLEFIYPPYVEQVEIIKVIKRKLEDIEVITKKINTQISKLKEYRESLIYGAVTGKIDLRDYESEME